MLMTAGGSEHSFLCSLSVLFSFLYLWLLVVPFKGRIRPALHISLLPKPKCRGMTCVQFLAASFISVLLIVLLSVGGFKKKCLDFTQIYFQV